MGHGIGDGPPLAIGVAISPIPVIAIIPAGDGIGSLSS
jgi:hypothetical protein